MITQDDYLKALEIIKAYHSQEAEIAANLIQEESIRFEIEKYKKINNELQHRRILSQKSITTLDTPIIELNLSTRAINACLRNDIKTLGDLVKLPNKFIIRQWSGAGKTTMYEIDDFVYDIGLKFGMFPNTNKF